jgi:iron complex transport system substrate-binding protein
VSADGATTETLFALGLGDRIVGRDRTSIAPAETGDIPQVGLPFDLSAEGVLAQKPTLLLGEPAMGPPAVVDQIRSAGVRVEMVPPASGVEGASERILSIGRIVGREKEAKALVERVKADVAKAHECGGASETKPRVACLYLRGQRAMLFLGRESAPAALLDAAGGENVFAHVEKSLPMSAESLAAAKPDAFLVMRGGLESVGGIDGLLEIPGVALTPAGKSRRVIVMEDSLVGVLGPRTGQAALELCNALHAPPPVKASETGGASASGSGASSR